MDLLWHGSESFNKKGCLEIISKINRYLSSCESAAPGYARVSMVLRKKSRKQQSILSVYILSIPLLICMPSIISAQEVTYATGKHMPVVTSISGISEAFFVAVSEEGLSKASPRDTVADKHVNIKVENELITLKADKAELKRILTALSDATGYPISTVDIDELESTKISVEFEKYTIDKALSAIMGKRLAGGYALVSNTDGKRIYVLTKAGSEINNNAGPINSINQSNNTYTSRGSSSSYLSPGSAKDVLWLRNHRALLSIDKEYRDLVKAIKNTEQGGDLQLPDFNRWSRILYEDAILAEFLSANVSEIKRQELSQLIGHLPETLNLELLGTKIPSTNKYYPSALKELLNQAQAMKQVAMTQDQVVSQANKYIDLVNMRKDYSDNYYKTEMRALLVDESIGVQDKVKYMEPYLQNKDWGLVYYGYKYFEELPKHTEITKREKVTIDEFLERAKEEE